MKRASMKENSRNTLLLWGLALLLCSSCGNYRHGNFNQQKYTTLKNKAVYPDDPQTEDGAIPTTENNSSYTTVEDQNKNVLPGSDQAENIMQADEVVVSTFPEKTSKAIKEEPTTHQPTEISENEFKERRNFNDLSDREKNQALISFNRVFNVGLGMIIFSFLLLTFCILFAAMNIAMIPAILGVAGGALLFSSWIMSMVALNRVRKINQSAYSLNFRVKLMLARLVAYIGIAVCIITITPGIILLILWAFHVISI
ncbi:MAG: hypothetical protein WDZ35_09830 [Crocinitomicaceae bacterium]